MYIYTYICICPPKDWLGKNGMNLKKAGGIEIYCAREYLQSRDDWGVGGVMLHEFSHAYHNIHCPDGFDNEEIRNVSY
jgi:hypothetical protein